MCATNESRGYFCLNFVVDLDEDLDEVKTCNKLFYRFAFGHYSINAKVAELKKTLCVEQIV